MTGYRDDRETLLRRIETLEEELADARADDDTAADDLTGLRRDKAELRAALKREQAKNDAAERDEAQLKADLAALEAEVKARPTALAERVAWCGVLAALGLALLTALGMPGALVIVAGVACALGFGLYGASLRNAPAPPPPPASRKKMKRRSLRARVETEQRRQEARLASKRRSRKRRRRRR